MIDTTMQIKAYVRFPAIVVDFRPFLPHLVDDSVFDIVSVVLDELHKEGLGGHVVERSFFQNSKKKQKVPERPLRNPCRRLFLTSEELRIRIQLLTAD